MAAAARRGGPDAALKEIRNRLAALQSEITAPSDLERNIERVRQIHMAALTVAVAEYSGTPESQAGRAARMKIQNLEYAIDAFYDFVLGRGAHGSDEHVIGRARVARYLRDTLEEAIDHFGTP
jgi:hypothetical protein